MNDGSLGVVWHSRNGVMRAIEEYFGRPFNRKKSFVDYYRGWLIKHHANCSGFTILEKVQAKN